MLFGERLKEERKRLKLSQTELAELAQVTKQSVFAYEKGNRKPDAAFLEAAANAGMDMSYLFTGERSGVDPVSAEDRRLLDLFRHATPAMRQAALVLLATGTGMGGTNINISGNGANAVAVNGGTATVEAPKRKKKA